MDPSSGFSIFWWISAIEVPALAGLFTLWWRSRKELATSLTQLERELRLLDEDQRAELDAFKLEVAKSYASISALKDVERRLTAHLVRIEQKLDRVPLSKMQAS